MILSGYLIFCFCLGYASSTDCPSGWFVYGQSCYLFARNHSSSFTEAEHYCLQHHEAHLIEIETADENLYIKDYLRGVKSHYYWIGLTDELAESVWVWYTSQVHASYTDWSKGEPSNSQGKEDCVVYDPSMGYKWNDVTCTGKAEPLCEISYSTEPIVG